MIRGAISTVVAASSLVVCSFALPWGSAEARGKDTKDPREQAVARARVWTPTRVAAANIKTGPRRPDAFSFRKTIECDYLPKQMAGASPKFACMLGEDDELKVKFGGTNAEVYAEVAATRLLWALGFAADQVYPVRVICRKCPATLAGLARDNDLWVFDPAIVERKLKARELDEAGWAWRELEAVNEENGGAPRAHRDGLKLLAVMLQHTDTKPQQQRLVCLDDAPKKSTACARPMMMLNDVGLTFGRANMFNANDKAMNLAMWSTTPVWKGESGCVGNLPKSLTGTLDNPVISEAGRAFLAGLLNQLTDAQLRDLFDVARVSLRLRDPAKARSGFATTEEWVAAFKQKRTEITERRCA